MQWRGINGKEAVPGARWYGVAKGRPLGWGDASPRTPASSICPALCWTQRSLSASQESPITKNMSKFNPNFILQPHGSAFPLADYDLFIQHDEAAPVSRSTRSRQRRNKTGLTLTSAMEPRLVPDRVQQQGLLPVL